VEGGHVLKANHFITPVLGYKYFGMTVLKTISKSTYHLWHVTKLLQKYSCYVTSQLL